MTYNTAMEIVEFTKVRKQLKRLSSHIVVKLRAWAHDVERFGLRVVRKVAGYHDKPLKGKRQGQRAIRLSKAYRAIYTQNKDGDVTIVTIEEVSKHEY